MPDETYFVLLAEQAENKLEITLFNFQRSFYYTNEFDTWLKDY